MYSCVNGKKLLSSHTNDAVSKHFFNRIVFFENNVVGWKSPLYWYIEEMMKDFDRYICKYIIISQIMNLPVSITPFEQHEHMLSFLGLFVRIRTIVSKI